MKFRFEIVYRLGLALLLVIAFWSVWANAQPATATNLPPVAEGTSTNQFQALTFGLDKVDFLNDHKFLGQRLWKHLASLIYIVLVFCVAWLLDFIVGVVLHRWLPRPKPIMTTSC